MMQAIKRALDDADIIITSPGIPASHPLIQYALEINIPIWSELELGWSLLPPQERKRTIAVTGTNGKTTAVNLLGHMLSVNNLKVKVCGNIGDPIINTVDEKGIYRVIEVSSFQLERSNSFAPFIGILLNISSDHIDRHGTIELYAETKFKLFSYQTRSEFSILNKDDPIITQTASGITLKPKVVNYGLKQDKGLNLWYDRPYVVYEIGQKQGRISIEKANLGGKHNILNIIACLAAAVILGIEDNIIERAVSDFMPSSIVWSTWEIAGGLIAIMIPKQPILMPQLLPLIISANP
ncbi:MAG: Mur ligase family protein [Actinomycetota bacterium]|nr:Mur ligase family protein [Actinomycetota bacterium]